jgi:hypothetical protein
VRCCGGLGQEARAAAAWRCAVRHRRCNVGWGRAGQGVQRQGLGFCAGLGCCPRHSLSPSPASLAAPRPPTHTLAPRRRPPDAAQRVPRVQGPGRGPQLVLRPLPQRQGHQVCRQRAHAVGEPRPPHTRSSLVNPACPATARALSPPCLPAVARHLFWLFNPAPPAPSPGAHLHAPGRAHDVDQLRGPQLLHQHPQGHPLRLLHAGGPSALSRCCQLHSGRATRADLG